MLMSFLVHKARSRSEGSWRWYKEASVGRGSGGWRWRQCTCW